MTLKWKARMEVKDLKMNTGKTKVMFSGPTTVRAEETGK